MPWRLTTSVVWTCQTSENNFAMKHKFAKYLKESCSWNSDEQLSLKYFLNIAFVREISAKPSDRFGCYRHEWVIEICMSLVEINPLHEGLTFLI